MNIDTTRVQNKNYKDAIKPELQKKSQEYRVLATLRYFYPERFNCLYLADKPDLQNKDASFGIEVTIANTKTNMKASREFSKLKNSNNKLEIVRRIETTGHTIFEKNNVCSLESPLLLVQDEKYAFDQAIIRKVNKIKVYSKSFLSLGLAVLLIEIPSSEAEKNIPDWINLCVKKTDDKCFDIYYVLCHRFLLVCDECGRITEKKTLTFDQHKHLSIIGRMTAEGEIELSDIEWQ